MKEVTDILNHQFSDDNEKSSLEADVLHLINYYKDFTIDEIRDILYQKSGIEQKLNCFIKEQKITPGAVISYGTPNYNEIITIGNAKEGTNSDLMKEDTIFDLASVSKIFMTLSILKLTSMGFVNINDEITKYCPEFPFLKKVTIFDLITFKTPLITAQRLDEAKDKEEAYHLLKNIKVNEKKVSKVYTDMGPMVLKYVIESATQMPYYHFLKEFILDKAQMPDTLYHPVDNKRIASTSDSIKILDHDVVDILSYPDGEVNDPKARKMQSTLGDLCGHAGMFSTASDMTNLALSIIKGSLLSEQEIEDMTKNQTGSLFYDKGLLKSKQYFGYLCYLKNPVASDTEVYHLLSDKAFAYAGFTGNQLTIDPLNKVYLFLGSNRVHNRITYIDPNVQSHYDKSKKEIYLPNLGYKIDSRSFAYERDEWIIEPLLKLCLQYCFLENYYIQSRDVPFQRVRNI